VLDLPETRYAKSGDVRIAYQVVGHGPIDLLYAPSFITHVEFAWERPEIARFYEALGSLARLILYDKRGTGLSDPFVGPPTLEQRVDDIEAVLDAVGSERAALFGSSEGAPNCTVFAATYPGRVSHLIVFSPFVVAMRDDECPWAWAPEYFEMFIESIDHAWDTGLGLEMVCPSLVGDERAQRWYGRFWRHSASPAIAKALMRLNANLDIRAALPAIAVPTLVLHRTDEVFINVEYGRYVARKIPGAKFVELAGVDHEPWEGDARAVVGEIEEFLTGTRHEQVPERALATVLFTDIVGSTHQAAELGDSRWRRVLDEHDALVRHQLERFRGREVKTTGDGFLARFDSPARTIQSALAMSDAAQRLGIELRCGVHTSEVELRGEDLGGIGVHIGQRIEALAAPGEVLVSRTVRDLVAGSGIEFDDRGMHALKGVPDSWQLFRVTST
jgi:class 3 adenylate cyclase